MITFLLSPLGKAAAAAAIIVTLFGLWQADRAWQRRIGAQEARQEAADRAKDLIRRRAEDDAQLKKLSLPQLCEELGGDWDKETKECL